MSCLGRTRASDGQTGASNRAAGAGVPTLVIHGGSGGFTHEQYPPELVRQHKEGLRDALHRGNKILAAGGSALDAVVAAVASMEDNPLFNSGKGAVYNIAGNHELDASVATSRPPHNAGPNVLENRRGAAVALLAHVKNPVELAKALYLDPKACPHPFVSGPDAERIAADKGLEIVDNAYFHTEARWREHRRELGLPEDPYPPTDNETAMPPRYTLPGDVKSPAWLPKGTVGAVALDAHGVLACATSTGGMTNKNVGRIGDTPSMGSGFSCTTWPAPTKRSLLDSLAGTTSDKKKRGVAVSGTGNGDFYIRNSATHDVVARMKYLHEDVGTASREVMQYLKTQEGEGGMICIDESGNYAMPLNTSGMFRGAINAREGVARVACWADDELEEIR